MTNANSNPDIAETLPPVTPAGLTPRACLRYLAALVAAVLLMAIVWLGLARLQTGVPSESSRLTSELYTRKLAIAEAAPSPKLVLVGGSASHFGIRTSDIAQALNIRAVNFASNYWMYLDYILYKARQAVRPGDTVLLVLEYDLYQNVTGLNDYLVDYAYARDPDYLLTRSPLDRLRFAFALSPSRLAKGLKRRLRPTSETTLRHRDESLNANGDETNNREANRDPSLVARGEPTVPFEVGPDTPAGREIADFSRWCAAHRVRLLASYPNTIHFAAYNQPEARRFFADIAGLYHSLGIPTLGTPYNFMYDPSLFYDTHYHLIDRGTTLRTRQTIAALAPWFPPPASH